MKIAEIQEAAEMVQNNLLIISENANAVEASLSEKVLIADQVTFALVGITRDVNRAAQDIENIINELYSIREIMNKL